MSSNNNIEVEQLELTSEAQQERLQHEAVLREMEIQKKAFSVVVPTFIKDIHAKLRELGEPIILFGENPANVRDRLRLCLARIEVYKQQQQPIDGSIIKGETDNIHPGAKVPHSQHQQQETKYTHASKELIKVRDKISKYSLEQSKLRLIRERKYRTAASILWQRSKDRGAPSPMDEEDGGEKNTKEETQEKAKEEEHEEDIANMLKMNQDCINLYSHIRKEMNLESSQYGGDSRPLSAISCDYFPSDQMLSDKNENNSIWMVATGGWSGSLKLWDAKTNLELLGEKAMAHEDRIMGVALSPQSLGGNRMLASASIDLSAKLWKIISNDDTSNGDGDVEMKDDDDKKQQQMNNNIVELSHLKGHEARLCKVAWHPTGRFVGTTSFDHTWRLWDVETSSQILLQDGHWKETYGISMNHPDGSLCCTTDYGGVIQLWDLRTGKSISNLCQHAKRVLCTDFSPNGFHLASSGDDGTIKIWDLRRKGKNVLASIPAHSKLVTELKFDPVHGESLCSSSFDGTVRLWSSRDWNMLKVLRGHEGKVMGAGFVNQGKGVVSVGFDKTLKLWN